MLSKITVGKNEKGTLRKIRVIGFGVFHKSISQMGKSCLSIKKQFILLIKLRRGKFSSVQEEMDNE